MTKNTVKEIEDLIKMAEQKNSNIPLLLEDAYKRGYIQGIELTKLTILEEITQLLKPR